MSYLNIIAAILDVAGSQPIQPLRRFIFTPPQIPSRETFLYCAMVNFLLFSRNYMNLILFWYIIAGMLWFPLVFLNVLATILLHFSKKRLNNRLKENNCDNGIKDGCINYNFSLNNNNNVNNGNNFSNESEAQGQFVERKLSINNPVNSSNNNSINQFSEVIQVSTPSVSTKNFTAFSLGSSPINPCPFPCSPKEISLNNINNSDKNVDNIYKSHSKVQKNHHFVIEGIGIIGFILRKIKKFVKIFGKRHLILFFKLIQLFCCFLIIYEYGFIYPFLLLVVFPITTIAVHAVITPYDDEASAFFDNAIKKYKIKHLKQIKQQISENNNVNVSGINTNNSNSSNGNTVIRCEISENKGAMSPKSNSSYKININSNDNLNSNLVVDSEKLIRTSKSIDSFDEFFNNNRVKLANYKKSSSGLNTKLNFINSNFAFYPSTPVQSFRNVNQW